MVFGAFGGMIGGAVIVFVEMTVLGGWDTCEQVLVRPELPIRAGKPIEAKFNTECTKLALENLDHRVRVGTVRCCPRRMRGVDR